MYLLYLNLASAEAAAAAASEMSTYTATMTRNLQYNSSRSELKRESLGVYEERRPNKMNKN